MLNKLQMLSAGTATMDAAMIDGLPGMHLAPGRVLIDQPTLTRLQSQGLSSIRDVPRIEPRRQPARQTQTDFLSSDEIIESTTIPPTTDPAGDLLRQQRDWEFRIVRDTIEQERKERAAAKAGVSSPLKIERIGDEAHLRFVGRVGDEPGDLTEANFTRALSSVGNANRLVIFFNSSGGLLGVGLAMGAALLELSIPTEARIAQASSAASLPALVCNEIKIFPDGRIVLHNSTDGTGGDQEAHRHTADVLEQVDNIISRIYALRSGQPVDKIRKMMTNGGCFFWRARSPQSQSCRRNHSGSKQTKPRPPESRNGTDQLRGSPGVS